MGRGFWTKERVDALKAHHAKGYTFLEIADLLNVTRSAIAGACRRHQLTHEGHYNRVGPRKRRPRVIQPKPKPEVFSTPPARPFHYEAQDKVPLVQAKYHWLPPIKRDLYAELRKAVENTAKLEVLP